MPGVGERRPQVALSLQFACDADQAVYGLIDPLHVAFVHHAWWWRKKGRPLVEKRKEFVPVPFGWQMARHALPPGSRAYRVLGANVTTEITLRLPALRIEHIRGDKHQVVSMTTLTPLAGHQTLVHHFLWWTVPWLGFLKPLIRRFARSFLQQDRDVLVKQREGLASHPRLMLVPDADAQIRWYDTLVREWRSAQAEGRTYKNPVPGGTLRWRS